MSVLTRALVTSVSVSGNLQKQLGESTHPIGRTSFMHIILPSSPGADGITYANAPTCDQLNSAVAVRICNVKI